MSKENVRSNRRVRAAVAGVSMSKENVRSNRRVRAAAPVMQLREDVGTVSIQAAQSGGSPKIQTDSSILVQGGSLRTWSYRSPAVEQVQVVLGTEGRPLDADIELWH